jgi:sulfatase maturation enzyme AslB (radical SAM superfamily)
MPVKQGLLTIAEWAKDNLYAIRFSGGEPTVYEPLYDLVKYSKLMGIEKIAVSTNGSASEWTYKSLLKAGVNDFSISLDACCSSDAEVMSGLNDMQFDALCDNIRTLASYTYVTVGVVLNEKNIDRLLDIIMFAHEMRVADIRIIPAAQYADRLGKIDIPEYVLNAHPILKFRHEQSKLNAPVRGEPCKRCPLVMDDSVVAQDNHYPCIIYLREGGEPIGKVSGGEGLTMREQRVRWSTTHDAEKDPICSKNCLDFCVHYNKQWMRFKGWM